MAINTNFNIDEFKALLDNTNTKIHSDMATYHTRFHETIRSNPIMHIHDYIYNTVEYGKFNGTYNRLLFGGEIDFITLSVYDILCNISIWRYFNVANDVEFIKVKNDNPEEELNFGQNYGFKYVIKYHRDGIGFDREFEIISSPKIIKNTIDELKLYTEVGYCADLYDRFELFGFVDYIDSIENIDEYTQNLQDESISKRQVLTIDIGQFANKDCHKLNSIYDYCQLIKPTATGLKKYYIDNLFDLSDEELKNFGRKRFQDAIVLAYNIQYPILYNIKK